MKRLIQTLALSLLTITLFSQEEVVPLHWHMLDQQADGFYGISADRAYTELLAGKKSTPVVVAVIDSGTETFHEDLGQNIWTNAKEIAGNGKDDDNNGYADDVHGWSFIGGKEGDVEFDNLEFTRIYKPLHAGFSGKTEDQIGAADKADYARYQKLDTEYQTRMADTQSQLEQIDQIVAVMQMAQDAITKELGKASFTVEEVEALETTDEYMGSMKELMLVMLKENLADQIEDGRAHFSNAINYSYNLDYDSRSIVGDDYSNPNERNYGNNHVDGPKAEHGTHVAGIIGALRNEIGVTGICENAQLMIIRCVPDGDERDKDVANAIRYATDNGARVINMSFGKSYSPFKEVVDEAVKYAESKGVLLIHAAGNDSRNIDKNENFPTGKYNNGKFCSTWISIGASGPSDSDLVASFSNYGKKTVDVFAPGSEIYSTMTGNTYKKESGTSMASPVTAGVAATLFSYFPNLTAVQVKEIIMKSSAKYKNQGVKLPGDDKKTTRLKRICVTGGIVNLYNAVKMAETYSSN